MKNTSVSLGDHYTKFVNTQVQVGRYGSASEVLRAGLRLLEEREIRIKALQATLIAGEESGPPAVFDSEGLGKRLLFHSNCSLQSANLINHALNHCRMWHQIINLTIIFVHFYNIVPKNSLVTAVDLKLFQRQTVSKKLSCHAKKLCNLKSGTHNL